MELPHERGFPMRFNVTAIGRRRVGSAGYGAAAFAGKGRVGVQVQLTDDQLGDGIALQNVGLRVHRDHVVIVGIARAGVGTLQARCVGPLAIDHDPPNRFVNRRG